MTGQNTEPNPELALKERNAARLRTDIVESRVTKFEYTRDQAENYAVPEGFWEDLTADGELTILITEAHKKQAVDQSMPDRPDWTVLVLRQPPSIMTLFQSIDGHLELMRDFQKAGWIEYTNTLYLLGEAHGIDTEGAKLMELFMPPDPFTDA